VSDQPTPAPSEEEAVILVGGMTREAFLGEPERIDFPQPKRSISKRSPTHSVEQARANRASARGLNPGVAGRGEAPVQARGLTVFRAPRAQGSTV
jgi:hypothetical protein